MTVLAAWSFIRANWKLAGLALLLLALGVQTVRLGHQRNVSDGLRVSLNEARAELKRISTAKNEQKAETGKRVEQAEKGNREADKIAERIEKAPPTRECKTPEIILNSDL